MEYYEELKIIRHCFWIIVILFVITFASIFIYENHSICVVGSKLYRLWVAIQTDVWNVKSALVVIFLQHLILGSDLITWLGKKSSWIKFEVKKQWVLIKTVCWSMMHEYMSIYWMFILCVHKIQLVLSFPIKQ